MHAQDKQHVWQTVQKGKRTRRMELKALHRFDPRAARKRRSSRLYAKILKRKQ